MLAGQAAAQADTALAAPASSFARLPEVIVTAPSADSSLRQVPHSVSVITADDIARSPASSVTDLLSREANLNLQSYYGSDKKATVDMRGIGDTAGSNVLIMLDGVRLNELDLSGADLTAVPLSQIERIEIVRGGGAVRYGNGAVAGVINIITKRGASPNSLELQIGRGSYGLRDGRARIHANAGLLGLSLNLSEFNSDGYRSNGYLSSRSASGEARLVVPLGLNFMEAWVRVADHSDRNGFPGAVSAADFVTSSAARRATATPDDFGTTSDRSSTAGLFADFGRAGRWELQTSYRDRDNVYVLGYTPLAPVADQLSTISSQRRDISLRYDNEVQAFGREHAVSAGWQSQSGDYARYANGRTVPEQSEEKRGSVKTHAVFASTIVRASSTVSINACLRANRFSTDLDDARYTRNCAFKPFPVKVCTPYAFASTNTSGGNWRNHGSEIGITWNPTPQLTTFASNTHHFRNPNLDELAAAAVDLRPQSGRTDELGARWTPAATLELSATVFEMRNKDEIYYGADPASGLSANRNYDQPTRRSGAEIEAQWQATPRVHLRANIGCVVPRFVGTDADIPHVPRQTVNLQARWKVGDQLHWSVALRHVGKRFDGNDFSNLAWPRLPAYTVVDMLWRVDMGAAEFALGINNLFNRAYSTLGYSATYYPMPERNLTARLRYHW